MNEEELETVERKGKVYVEVLDPQEEEFNKIRIWPENWDPDEEIQGVYIKKRSNIGPNHQNVYRLKNEDGCVDIWGTTGLDSRFNSKNKPIPIGSELVIIFKGEKPSTPPKKPFKVFKIYILQKNRKHESETAPRLELQTQDHTQTDELIDQYREILESEYKPVTCEAIIRYAETDPDLKPTELTNVKVRLVELYKSGKIRSEKKQGGK